MTPSDTFDQLEFIASPVFVIEVNEDGLPVYVAINACACTMSGRPPSDYLGRTAKDIYEQSYGRTAFARHCQVIESGKPLTYELQLPMAGKQCRFQTTLHPETDDDGNVIRVYGTSIDITAENAMREANVSLGTNKTEMEQFIAMAAHDLRAPMRNVAILAQVLKEDFVDHGDGKLELIDMLDGVAEKTMGLINDVLTHAQSIDVECTEARFDLSDLACVICDVLDPKEQHHFTVTPATLLTDKTVLQIALRNLIENTVKHAGKAQILLDISVETVPGDRIMITLEDNGKGFSDAGLKLMNGGAFRVDSGYGLFGVRRIIQARGGEITARNSSLTGGALICFTLPGHIIAEDCITQQAAFAAMVSADRADQHLYSA